MKSVRLRVDGSGQSQITSLQLPMPTFGPTASADEIGEPIGAEANGASFERLSQGSDEPGPRRRVLRFVLQGDYVLTASNGSARLEPGDVVLVDDLDSLGHRVYSQTGAVLLDIEIGPGWLPSGTVPPPLAGNNQGQRVPRFRRMYVESGQAHFADFADFDDVLESVGSFPVDGLNFICLSAGVASDWHTEPGVSLVVVMEGGFELEVSGHGGAQVFLAGDFCLVDDRSGKGHLTRTHGETRFAALALPSGGHWTR